ncbi:MAG: hypothetical protein Q9171_001507 [Xanthocarpia ochracea]
MAAAKHTGLKHQRNHSSSKASNSSKDEARPLTTASEAPSNERPAAASPAEKRSSGRRTSRTAPKSPVTKTRRDAYPNIPSVPSTQHLHPQNIQVASFFSHHRPISVTRSFPPSSSESQFSSIFESKSPSKTPIGDVIYTVSSAIEGFENAAAFEQQPISPSSKRSFSSNETTHLDGEPQHIILDTTELSKNFRPFVAPPAPVAFDDSKSASLRRSKAIKERSFSTTLTITEQAHPNGQKTYQAHISPMREDLVSPTVHAPSSTAPSQHNIQNEEVEVIDITPPSGRQPFLERMKNRHRAWEDGLSGPKRQIWRAISVKRQRKLKMKKHKYKKLMRKTRNLRRRLDKN